MYSDKNVHSENKFVLAEEIEITENFKCVLSLMYEGKDLTIGAMILSK